MQVRARRTAGRTHRRDPLPAYDEVPLVHEYFQRVGIAGNQPIAMVNRENLTILGRVEGTGERDENDPESESAKGPVPPIEGQRSCARRGARDENDVQLGAPDLSQ